MSESVKQLQELKRRVLSTRQLQQPRNRLGARGERLAQEFLRTHSYTIFSTNAQFGALELDIVALDNEQDELAFIEVKTRSSTQVHPAHALTHSKIKALERAAHRWRQSTFARKSGAHNLPYRFDLLAIIGSNIEHFQNITFF